MPHTPHDRSLLIKQFALSLGFDLVGITRADPSAHEDAYRAWIEAGKHGDMAYLTGNIEHRHHLTQKFPWAQSVVCVALSYFQQPPESAPPSESSGKIARYAWGRDYHKVIEKKLQKLESLIRDRFAAEVPTLQIRAYCDTGPILERELAARAGLGWIGKHTLLIHPRHGSWFVLGELILSLELQPDSPLADHCGTCRRCIEACPTDAIDPYTVDARKCISYLTLEHARDGTPIPPEFQAPMQEAGFVIGCDICQEVCPFNRRPLPTREPDFAPKPPAPSMPLAEILRWQESDWDIHTRGRAHRRAKYTMWQRSARALSGDDQSSE